MNLAAAFAASAQKHAAKPAIFWGEEEHSYERLWAQSRLLAAHLHRSFGVRPGDRVGLWLKNCPEFVPALFAVLASGAVVYAVEEVDDVEAWRAEIRRQARADRIKVRTGFSQASCGRNMGVRHATDDNQRRF